MSMSPVLGNLARLKTRFLYKVIDSRSTWDSRFNIGLHNPCEITLRIPRIFLRIRRKKFLGMKGVIFHRKLELGIPRNSKVKK